MERKAGVFDLEQIQGAPNPKWRVRNTITGVEHRTYGTWEEVEAQAILQSKAWQERLEKNAGVLMRKQGRYHEMRGSIVEARGKKS